MAQRPTEGTKVDKWEYVFVTCDYANDDWQPRYVNGEELRDWENGPPMYTFCNEMGNHGWEMVTLALTTTSQGSTLDYRLVFKRGKA